MLFTFTISYVARNKKIKTPKRPQTPGEEKANALTHALGIVFILATLPMLWKKAMAHPAPYTLWAVGIYVAGMLAVYISSTVYHFLVHPPLKQKAHIADHISIFLLIGGTYTPTVYLFTPLRTALIFLGVMWGIIALGVILKLFFTGKYNWLSTLLYLALGWMLVFLVQPLTQTMTSYVFIPILTGGLCYTIGVLFYVQRKIPYGHAVWHAFVLAGTIAHWVAVYRALG